MFYTVGMVTDIDAEPDPGWWDEAALYEPALLPRDPVAQVTDVATLLALHTAEQYTCVAEARRDAMRAAPVRACTDEMVDRSLRLELAAALRITEYAAGDLMVRATALVERYPGALEALRCARITDQHARFLIDVLDEAEPTVRSRLTDRAIELAEELPAGAFRRRLRDLVAVLSTETAIETRTRALDRRHVHVEQATEGMSRLTAYLPSVEAHAIFDRLTRMTAAITGRRAHDRRDTTGANHDVDERTLDQVRADVLCDLLIDGRCEGHAAAVRGIRPTVVVTVPALSLLAGETVDEPGGAGATASATVEGIGPIPIAQARLLSGGAKSWMRVLTHPETGVVLSVGRGRYEPPPELRRLVRWRAERCMAPGCTMPASRCEIDHTLAWQNGGATSADNLAPLCTGHHTVKHHGGWSVVQVPGSGGVVEWTSPYGRRYLVEQERRMPVFQPETPVIDDTVPAPF